MDAFQTLMTRHETALLRLAYVMVRDAHAAQEVVQDVFMRCADKAASLVKQAEEKPQSDGIGVEYSSLRSWLCRVCRNLCLDRIRAKKPQQEFIDQELHEVEPPSLDSETENSLWRAVEKLSALERTVVILRYQEKLSYKELAQQLGKSVNHIGLLLHQAHENLRASAVLRAEVLP